MNQSLPDYLSEAAGLQAELFSLREAFHRTPELGNREFKTAERIEHTLRACGLRPRRVIDTGVVATLHGSRPGPTIALRADMDALPVQETTGAPFASETPGVMHACGHDVHLASVLGAAMLLSRHRHDLCGSVRFVFQPDEEGEGGAERMIAAGCMKGVSAVFGGHVTPDLPAGVVGVRYGKFYAASDTFQIRLFGRAAHGAEREKGVDALEAGALLVQELLKLPERLSGERSVVSVGTFRAGTARNIVADEAEITGIMRTLGDEARLTMRSLMRDACRGVANKTDVSVEIQLQKSYSGVINHDAETDHVRRVAGELFGRKNVVVLDLPTMKTDDFGYFLLHRPGVYYHFGAGCDQPLHSPNFLPEAHTVVTGTALHAAVLHSYLNQRNHTER